MLKEFRYNLLPCFRISYIISCQPSGGQVEFPAMLQMVSRRRNSKLQLLLLLFRNQLVADLKRRSYLVQRLNNPVAVLSTKAVLVLLAQAVVVVATLNSPAVEMWTCHLLTSLARNLADSMP